MDDETSVSTLKWSVVAVSRDRRLGRWWQRREGGCRRVKEWPPTGEKADSGKGCVDESGREARVQGRMRQGKNRKMKVIWP